MELWVVQDDASWEARLREGRPNLRKCVLPAAMHAKREVSLLGKWGNLRKCVHAGGTHAKTDVSAPNRPPNLRICVLPAAMHAKTDVSLLGKWGNLRICVLPGDMHANEDVSLARGHSRAGARRPRTDGGGRVTGKRAYPSPKTPFGERTSAGIPAKIGLASQDSRETAFGEVFPAKARLASLARRENSGIALARRGL